MFEFIHVKVSKQINLSLKINSSFKLYQLRRQNQFCSRAIKHVKINSKPLESILTPPKVEPKFNHNSFYLVAIINFTKLNNQNKISLQ
jgi:hypothetical protein